MAPTRPSPRLGSKPENKTHVWEGGASAAGRTGSTRLQEGEMLRHGANMDAGLLSFFSLEEQASPGAPKSCFKGAETSQSNGNETLGWVGRFPRSFTPSISKALQFLLCHQGSDLRRAKETIADSSMDVPEYWGDALFALGAEEAKGSGESLSPHPPTVTGCQTQAPETSAPIIYSPWPAQSRVPRRGQRHLNFF